MAVAPQPSYYPAVTPTPYYNWSGLYAGVNAGWGWSAQLQDNIIDFPTGALIAVPSHSTSGFAGGGQVGYNWFAVPNYVIGVEGDFDALSNSTNVVSIDGTSSENYKLKYFSTLRARFGLTTDRLMFYLTGGGAWAQDQVTRTQLTGAANFASAGTIESVTNNRWGWVGGPGVEYAFASNLSFRLEYLYAHLNGTHYTFPLAERTTTASYEPISMLRIGINYQFGGGDTVSSRY